MPTEHNVITDPELHEPKAIAVAVAGTVYVANGAGSGAWTNLSGAATVVINAIGDFPTPSGGIITLAADTIYLIGAAISTANRFVLGNNTTVTSGSLFGPILDYTGVGDMFTGTDVSALFQDLRIDCSGGGTVFNITDTVGGVKTVGLVNTRVISCGKVGTFDDLFGLSTDAFAAFDADDGIEILGTNWQLLSLVRSAILSATSTTYTGLKLGTSVHQVLELTNTRFSALTPSVGISGSASSANLAANRLATVNFCEFLDTIVPLGTITKGDLRWVFRDNDGIDDTTKSADVFLTGTETVTNGGLGVFVPVNGTNWTSDISEKFSTTTGGVITYDSEQDDCFFIVATASIEKVGGGANQLAMRISKNGTEDAKSEAVTQSADPTSVTCIAILQLTKTDTITVEVSNLDSGTPNTTVTRANISVTRSG